MRLPYIGSKQTIIADSRIDGNYRVVALIDRITHTEIKYVSEHRRIIAAWSACERLRQKGQEAIIVSPDLAEPGVGYELEDRRSFTGIAPLIFVYAQLSVERYALREKEMAEKMVELTGISVH